MGPVTQGAGTGSHFLTCPLCEATCGLELLLDDDGAVKVIRGDRNDVFSAGYICPKGTTLNRLHTDPDRLRRPLVRRRLLDDGQAAAGDPDEMVETGWEEAWRAVEAGLGPLLAEHGRDAVAVYLGNPTAHNHATTIFVRPLLKALGTRNVFSASTVDQMPKHVASGFLFGNGLTIAVPDLDRTGHLLMLGANPLESNGSLCTAPDFPGRLAALRERGGRLVVVDPRRTRTAEMADEHVAIRPGTDAHLLVAMVNVLFAEDLVAAGPAGAHLSGLDTVATAVTPFTPEAVAPITGVDADTIRRMTRDLAAAERAAVYARIGTTTVEFGTIASWAVDVLNALTGNLDRPGGVMWPSPAHKRRRTRAGGRGFGIGRWHSRAGGHPEVQGELPAAALADQVNTPGEDRVRALVTIGGNPVLSTPQSERLDETLERLDFMVSVDPYLNETTRHADVVLPPPTHLERSQYDLAFYALSVRNIANWSPALYEPDGPTDADILARLALVASGMGADADPAVIHDLTIDTLLADAVSAEDGPLAGRDPAELRDLLVARDPADRAVEVMIRSGQHGDQFGEVPGGLNFEVLSDSPHGVDLGPLVPQLPEILSTASGTVELDAAPIVADLGRLAGSLQREWPELVLVGRRDLRSNNSWMHNVEVLVKGRERCTLQVNPADAESRGISEGSSARISSRVGTLVAPVEITDAVAPGVVSLPHGWGHGAPGTRTTVAAGRPGVNANVLTDPAVLDPLSGNAALNAVPVTLEPA